ncbi:MAG: B12-binding domain-containing radical SAM protein [Candidatus Omnitrophica bacterium]|nr:B12-binding domain-containing radical SAM protein [Candidatus Omnitrophota bacterium]
MKILLIMPDANIHKMKLGKFSISFREAPLTLTTLAALVPRQLNARIRIVDENIDDIPFNENYDIVGISCLTGTAMRAYSIADFFMSKGSTVILGGIHVCLMPSEAIEHAHSIVVGFAETTWPQLLRDYALGKLKKVYRSHKSNIQGIPEPRRDLQKKFGYLNPYTVFATRGCRRACDFCTVSAMPFGWYTRPVGEVIDEIRKIKAKRFAFNDVSLLEDSEYAKELFTALIPLRKVWGGLCTTQVGHDDEMLELMRRSGCVYLLIGFESVSNKALYDIRKGFNNPNNYPQLIKKIHGKGIIIQGCFIFGFDNDDRNIFRHTVEAVNDLKIDIPRYAIYTPYPKTKVFERLKSEKRILHENWRFYDTQHVVFQPARMSPEELDTGFKWAYRQTFKYSSINQRILGNSKSFLIKFFGNLAYKLYVRRLDCDLDRFPELSDGLNGIERILPNLTDTQKSFVYEDHSY